MFCQKCGKEIPDWETRCMYCGASNRFNKMTNADSSYRGYTPGIQNAELKYASLDVRGNVLYAFERGAYDETEWLISRMSNVSFDGDRLFFNYIGKEYLIGYISGDSIGAYNSILEVQIKNRYSSSQKQQIKEEIEPIIDDHLNRGNRCLEQGNYAEAIKEYTKYLWGHRGSAKVYFDRATAYRKIDELEKAVSDYNTSILLDKNYTDAYFYRACCYLDLGRPKYAINDFNKVISLEPDADDAFNFRSIAYSDLEMLDEAVEDATKAIRLNKFYVNAYFNRATYYFELKDYQNSINDYSKVLSMKHDDASAYYLRSLVYKEINKLSEGDDDYKKAISIDPEVEENNKDLVDIIYNYHEEDNHG